MSKKQILVVCRGNIVRSPFAQKLINIQISQRGLTDKITCISRGIQGSEVDPIPPKFKHIGFYKNDFSMVKPITDRLNIDLTDHESKTVSLEDILRADIVIAMDDKTLYSLNSISPESRSKTIKITKLVNKQNNIIDPEGIKIAEEYELILSNISEAISLGFDKLLRILNI